MQTPDRIDGADKRFMQHNKPKLKIVATVGNSTLYLRNILRSNKSRTATLRHPLPVLNYQSIDIIKYYRNVF